MTVDQRPVEWAEVKAGTFVECGLCGTAAVISPVGEIDNKVYGADETVTFPAGYTEIGPVMKKLRETLTGIQSGAVEDKHNWVYRRTPQDERSPRRTKCAARASCMSEDAPGGNLLSALRVRRCHNRQ